MLNSSRSLKVAFLDLIGRLSCQSKQQLRNSYIVKLEKLSDRADLHWASSVPFLPVLFLWYWSVLFYMINYKKSFNCFLCYLGESVSTHLSWELWLCYILQWITCGTVVDDPSRLKYIEVFVAVMWHAHFSSHWMAAYGYSPSPCRFYHDGFYCNDAPSCFVLRFNADVKSIQAGWTVVYSTRPTESAACLNPHVNGEGKKIYIFLSPLNHILFVAIELCTWLPFSELIRPTAKRQINPTRHSIREADW